MEIASIGTVYQTDSTEDYGSIQGNYDNKTPGEFIFSFFPEQLDPQFSDVTYHYRAKKVDGYGYECYLEFVIEDGEAYRQFIDQYVKSENATVFAYDSQFLEYLICDQLDIDLDDMFEDGGYSTDAAKIGRILYCEAEQRVIFSAMGVHDGGGTSTSDLRHFFDRFQIDIVEYYFQADSNYLNVDKQQEYRERFG